MSATRLFLTCMLKYCKLFVQNSSWWQTITCLKHVEDKIKSRVHIVGLSHICVSSSWSSSSLYFPFIHLWVQPKDVEIVITCCTIYLFDHRCQMTGDINLVFSIPKCYINTMCQSITQHFILYTIKVVYCQGDMFRPLLDDLQTIWESRSKSYLYFNALWDPKCLQIVLQEFKIHKFVYIKICVTFLALKG